MEGLHYSFGIACIWFSHERLLKRLIVELLHIFGYLGRTQENSFSARGGGGGENLSSRCA